MANTITETPAKVSKVMWQQGDTENGIGEPALLIEFYSNSVSITQEDRHITINKETIPDLIKLLKNPPPVK